MFFFVCFFDCLVFRNKIRTTKRRTESLATINLEDFFGPISLDNRENSVKYAYPNTVPQPKNTLAKAFGLPNDDLFDDDAKPAFSTSASLLKNRRPSHEHNPKAT